MSECKFCKSKLSNDYLLKRHQKTNKKCLKIQLDENDDEFIIESESDSENEFKSCEFCLKQITSNNFKRHLDTCKAKKRNYIDELLNENKELKRINDERSNYNSLKEENNELRNEMNVLKAKLEIFEKLYEKKDNDITEIAKQPKTKNNKINNIHLSNNHFNYFNEPEKVKQIIAEKLTMDYIMDGQKGVAEFTYHHLLKDQEGKSTYLCSDPSRKFFKFLREDGQYERDQKAERLTKMIVTGNIRKQTIQKATEFWTNEDGTQDVDKYILHNPSAQEIVDIEKDNSKFVNHLVTMITR
jgi:hypothetical protein